MLDVLTVVTVGVTLPDACIVAFLVKLPHLPMHPWPETKWENQELVFKAERYTDQKLSRSIFSCCCLSIPVTSYGLTDAQKMWDYVEKIPKQGGGVGCLFTKIYIYVM